MYISRHNIANLYLQILEEGVDEKIPKLLSFVPISDNVGGFKIQTDADKSKFIRWVAELFDPTPNGMYLGWILKMFKNGNLRGEEDSEKVYNTLQTFHTLKTKPQFPSEHKDINRFKSYGDLAKIVGNFSGVKSKKEIYREKEQGITLMGSDGEYKVYVVTEPEAAAKHFRDTEWCVTNPKFFNQYGAPYYYFTKNDEPFTLLHLKSNQCMDVYDRDVDLNPSQVDLMETEELTNYVLNYDNSEEAITNYQSRVGRGYDGLIWDHSYQIMLKLIKAEDLQHYIIQDDEYRISEGLFEASGYIPYNFKGLEDYFDEKEFQEIVSICLSKENIYMDYFSSDNFSDDADSVYINLSHSEYVGNYHSNMPIHQLKTFLNDISKLDADYETSVKSFGENLDEALLEGGYTSSGWAEFKNRVLDKMPRPGANNMNHNPYVVAFNTGLRWTDIFKNVSEFPLVKFAKSYPIDHPAILLSKFLKYFNGSEESQISIKLSKGDDSLKFIWRPSYDEDMSFKDYMRDYKIMRSLTNHYDSYSKEISDFCSEYILPYSTMSEDGTFNIPKNLNIPILTPRSRKSPKEQEYFQFRESKVTTFSDLHRRVLRFS